MIFQPYVCSIFVRLFPGNAWDQIWASWRHSMKCHCQRKKGIEGIPENNEFFKQVFSSSSRSVWATIKTQIGKDRMDVEKGLPKLIWQSIGPNKRRYTETRPLDLEMDVSGVGLVAGVLHVRDGMNYPWDEVPDITTLRLIAFASNSLWSAGKRYSNSKREALGILQGWEKFHLYCLARELSIIMDHKPFVAMLKKGIVTLSQRLQYKLLRICKYRIWITYKPLQDLFIADWLSQQEPYRETGWWNTWH